MTLSLKKKEEQFFIEAYKSFCQTLDGEKIGTTNYKLLETKNRQFKKAFPQFKKAFPHNDEVEHLFQALPAPVVQQKRTNTAQESGRPTKRQKRDEWDGQ